MHIIVIGAGVIGATSAYALRRRGHDVTVIEQQPQAAQGTSQANGGFLSAAHCAPWAAPGVPRMAAKSLLDRDAPFGWKPGSLSLSQVKWLRAMLAQCTSEKFALNRQRMVRLGIYSRACLQELEQFTGVTSERRDTGSLLVMRQSAQASAGQRHAEGLRAMGFDARWLEREATLALEPGLSHAKVPVAGGIFVSDDASGDCELFTQRLMQWNEAQGVQFLRAATVAPLQVEHGAQGTRLQAIWVDGRKLQADAYVVAAGCATPALLRTLMPVPVYPVKGYSLTVPVLDEARAPLRAVLDDGSKLAIARFDQRIRVAGVAEVAGFDLSLSPHRCQQLIEGLENLYPGAAKMAQVEHWAGLRPMTPDGTPIVGATPLKNLYLNTGHGTYGWTMASGSASLLADLITDQAAALPAGHYAWPRAA